jgi:hypothetical protein
MKSIVGVAEDIMYAKTLSEAEKLLRAYVSEIIDQCAGNAEATMEEEDREPGYQNYATKNGKKVYPVVLRSSILQVKSMII